MTAHTWSHLPWCLRQRFVLSLISSFFPGSGDYWKDNTGIGCTTREELAFISFAIDHFYNKTKWQREKGR